MLWQKHITDAELFNHEEFEYLLNTSELPLNVYKQALKSGSDFLINQFESGESIKDILYRRAWLIDQLLTNVWRNTISSEDISLIAVGGYARGELHPCSDIDLMILT